MENYPAMTVVLSVLAILIIPALVVMVRGAIKWTRVEDKLDRLVDEMVLLVKDKDATHAEMLSQMRSDRDATDRRLRFIEEAWMKHPGSR